jgi:glycosyltransferase involved in cell wall biosynthesis
VYCRLEFLNLLYQNNFDVVFCLNDIEIFNEMGEHLNNVKKTKLKENKPNFKTIVYFPIDSEPRPSDLKILSFFDEVFTYTEYGKNALKPLTTQANFKKIKVVPHGCNTKDFYPLSEEEKQNAKIEILGKERKNTYLFGSVNRNSARKDLSSIIIGFALFKHTNDVDSALYLHCNPTDSMGINIERLCQRVGLQFGYDVLTPTKFSENNGVSEEQLNKIYNAFDIFVTTTTAEGWGLSICEAMATKTLVICPQHTSITEITNNGENCISFKFSQRSVFVNDFEKIRYTTNPNEVAQVMGYAYNFKNEEEELQNILKEKIESAYNKMQTYKWETTANKFKEAIKKLS